MSSSVLCLFTKHCYKSLLSRGMGLSVCTVLNEKILKMVDVRCFVGEWLVHVKGMAVCGVFGSEQLLGCEGGI